MEIEIIAPCFYPSLASIPYFTMSANRYGLRVYTYGMGCPFTNWVDTHITSCLGILNGGSSSHVLFTDASDVIFMQGMKEIKTRYMCLGHPPMLVSEEENGINFGGWLGEREMAIAMLKYLELSNDSGDPQVRIRDAVRNKRIKVSGDYGRAIFAVNPVDIRTEDACILHLAGGYTDPDVGKKEVLEMAWTALGYDK